MINDFTQSFALEYAGARTKFRATASDLGGVLSEYRHPTATGPNGQGLFIDVARLGDVGAPLQLVVVSGTHGLHGLTKFLAGRPMVGAVIEFGTRGINIRRALQLDLWLKFKAEKGSERAHLLKADLRGCFVPVSSHWRESPTGQAISITQQAVEGLASWSLAAAA